MKRLLAALALACATAIALEGTITFAGRATLIDRPQLQAAMAGLPPGGPMSNSTWERRLNAIDEAVRGRAGVTAFLSDGNGGDAGLWND